MRRTGHAEKVFVGGIAASLMHGRFVLEPRWRGIRFIKGLCLLSRPAISLQLDDFAEELYSDGHIGYTNRGSGPRLQHPRTD